MAKPVPAQTNTVRLESGETVEVRGYGALKGQLKLQPGIDLTKPIYEQVMRKTAREANAHKR